jgi:hypothetical protein
LLPLLGLTGQAAAPPAAEGDPVAAALDRRVLAEAEKGSQVLANLTHLSDVIGPRLTGSAGLQRASTWAAQRMKECGLSAVRLEPWTIPEGWVRGRATARLIEPDNGRSLTVASMAWYPGTAGKVRGDLVVLQAKTTKDLAAYRGKLKNALVLSGAPRKVAPLAELARIERAPLSTPLARPGEKRTGPAGKERQAFQTEMRNFLRKEGALAVLLDSGKPLGLVVTTGGWRGKDRPSAENRLPTLFVAHDHYAMLHRLASRPAPARTRLELDVENQFVPGPVKVFNVVGELPGLEKPNEIVVVGAHLDSWDLGQGTTDNGTGSSVVLETARVLAKCGARPKRTIRFVLFSGEEQGLHGSRAHVEKHKDELPRISACLVHDTGSGRVRGIGCGGRPAVQALLQRELASLRGLGVTDFTSRSLPGSDHSSFSRAGVPGFLLVQDPAGYPLTHHTPADTLAFAREADLIQGTQVLAVTALRIANLPDLLPRAQR